MAFLFKTLLGPHLYRIYSSSNQEGQIYTPNLAEKAGDTGIQMVRFFLNVGVYASPFIISYLWKNNYFCYVGCITITKALTGLSIFLTVCLLTRGFGRATNSTYVHFLKLLSEAEKNRNIQTKAAVSLHDFDFSGWVPDFVNERKSPKTLSLGSQSKLVNAAGIPCYVITWLFAHLLGRPLMYPGSIRLIQYALDTHLQSGREKLVKGYKGQRNKLISDDGNYIDTIFVDRRERTTNGSTLVVCCEGNAGFYEIGIMVTPIDAGYSVLGWNHPGFGGSSGQPFPPQEQSAVDTVMQFALEKLGFVPENILVYAWSIGGYSGTWAALNYPNIKGLILDASFDDVLPLALPRMPVWMNGLVTKTIRNHMNLNNAENLIQYKGPVTIIRRTNDEIITTEENILATNRGNDLLQELLKSRYPNLFCLQAMETLKWFLSESSCHKGEKFTAANKYLVDVDSTHNTPLETRYFSFPWTLKCENTYSFPSLID